VLNVAVTLLPDTPRVREVELLARHVWGFYLPPTPYPLRAQRGRDPAAGHPARAGGGATGQARVGFCRDRFSTYRRLSIQGLRRAVGVRLQVNFYKRTRPNGVVRFYC
jgi:hypothetical protein